MSCENGTVANNDHSNGDDSDNVDDAASGDNYVNDDDNENTDDTAVTDATVADDNDDDTVENAEHTYYNVCDVNGDDITHDGNANIGGNGDVGNANVGVEMRTKIGV